MNLQRRFPALVLLGSMLLMGGRTEAEEVHLEDIPLPSYPPVQVPGGESPPGKPSGPGLDPATERKSIESHSQSVASGPEKAESNPSTPVDLHPRETIPSQGRVVSDDAQALMDAYGFEVLSSTREWRVRWNEPDFGFLRVASLPPHTNLPRGHLLRWHRDSLGNPSVRLVMHLFIPKLTTRDAFSRTEPGGNQILAISQTVSFCLQGHSWVALAAPLQVEIESEPARLLVSPSSGKGQWQAKLSSGGLWIEGLAEAGLAAARDLLPGYFRDEEIREFLEGHCDAIFYLRPRA